MATCEVAPARYRAETQHLLSIQGGGVRGGQILGDQNRLFAHLQRLLDFTRQVPEDAPPHVFEVVGTSRQQLIAKRGQPAGVSGVGMMPSEGRALALVDQRVGDLPEVGIL